KDNRLDFANLPVLEPYARNIFLTWLSKALERKDRRSKTEDGRTYYIEERTGSMCVVECTDGAFTMPEYTICFE
ncbi:MAG TPA: TIGR02677 family protein, partial [Lachnospiraceae bacterium]|nr:TIGR02677 family protein [Lachnospiraceae bacterium]